MPHAGRPALRRSSRSGRACGAASALSPKRSRAVLLCGTIMGASTCPMLSSRNLPSSASRVRLPSCGLPRGMAARSALFAPSRRTCSGCAPSTPSRNSVRRCSSFGRATTRPGSSNGTGSRHPPPCARASFHPRHGPRSMQSGVSQTAGGTALINQKGGVGKTTVALHLAAAFWQHGHNTLILDLDPQASAAEWHDARSTEMPHVESIQPARLAKVVEHAREIATGILILDTAPHAEATAIEAARCADLVLVPCQPSIMDLRAMRKTVDLLKLVKVRAFAVLNGVPAHGSVADEAAESIASDLGLSVAAARLGQRVAYDRCLIAGQAAQEYEPGGKAAAEVEQLYMWACEQVNLLTSSESRHEQPLQRRAN